MRLFNRIRQFNGTLSPRDRFVAYGASLVVGGAALVGAEAIVDQLSILPEAAEQVMSVAGRIALIGGATSVVLATPADQF